VFLCGSRRNAVATRYTMVPIVWVTVGPCVEEPRRFATSTRNKDLSPGHFDSDIHWPSHWPTCTIEYSVHCFSSSFSLWLVSLLRRKN